MDGASLNLMFAALRARFGTFLCVLAVTVMATAVVSLLLPKTYKATTSLVVDNKDEQSLSNVLHPLIPPRETIGYMQTQMDIISSEKVARKVIQDLRLADNPGTIAAFEKARGAGHASVVEWLVEGMLERLKVETSQSSVIRIAYSAPDAAFAAAVANGFAKAYVETMLELRVEPTRQAAAWFEEQLKGLRASLEDAQARLTDYHRQQGIVSADERFDVENTRLSELSTQLVRAQDQSIDLRAREQQARGFLERGSLDKLPEVLASPFIQRLKSDLMQSESRLQEMSAQYGVNYPQYQRQLADSRGLRERLDAEMAKVAAGMESAARQSREREAELRRALAEQRTRVLQFKGNRNELTVLARNVESAQRAYDTAMQRSVVSRVESRANQANVAILSPAVAPRTPARPKIMLNIALSIAVGGMLGAAVVLLMEMLDRRVRARADLERALEVPLLVVLDAWRAPGLALPGIRHGAYRLPNPG
jgi:succinoglycan biosynthesis transport protein ExoP